MNKMLGCILFVVMMAFSQEKQYLLELEGLLSAFSISDNYQIVASETAGFNPYRFLNIALGSEQQLRNNSISLNTFISSEYRWFLSNKGFSLGPMGGIRQLFIGTKGFSSLYLGAQTGIHFLPSQPVSVRIRYRFAVYPNSPDTFSNALLIGISLNLLQSGR